MEIVRAAALTGYFEVAQEFGLNVVPLLRRARISRAMLRNPEQSVPARAAFSLLDESAEASGCATFGLRMVEHRRLGDIGLLSVLIAHQSSLSDPMMARHVAKIVEAISTPRSGPSATRRRP